MNVLDHFRQLRGAAREPGRLLLTLFGIIVGSAAIVLVSGLLEGGKRALLRSNQQATGADLVHIKRLQLSEKEARHHPPELSRGDASALARLPTLIGKKIHGEGSRRSLARLGGREKRVRVVSGSPRTQKLYRLSLAKGRFVVPTDLSARRRVCVIGNEVYEELVARRTNKSEVTLTIDGRRWRVVGVLAEKPLIGSTTGTHVWDRKVIVPATTFDLFYSPAHHVESITLQNLDSTAMPTEAIRESITDLLLRRHAGAKNFELNDADGRRQEALILKLVELLLMATGALALFVGGINVMNMMLMRVRQRRKEIGLRRALGARRRDLLVSFLFEAVALSAVGGLLGLAFGGIGVWLGAASLAHVFWYFPFVMPKLALALGAGLSLVTGIVSGIWPAWQAAKLDPVAALKLA